MILFNLRNQTDIRVESGRRSRVQLQTKTGAGWRLAGFSNTQYASLHGAEHFQRCHFAVVELLAAFRPLGLHLKISEEGEYWPKRSLTRLCRNLDQMNGLVAATAGALKDFDEAANGLSRFQSPIFAHRQFERLEAEGPARVAPIMKRLRT